MCFLIPEQEQMKRTDREREEYQKLLNSWTDCFARDYDMMKCMIMKIDVLATAFPTNQNNNQYLLQFIGHMVNLCFQKGMSFTTYFLT